jgi:hypothetical protein
MVQDDPEPQRTLFVPPQRQRDLLGKSCETAKGLGRKAMGATGWTMNLY